jgi:putative spermidine/putrescine transport system ATP-binding protein
MHGTDTTHAYLSTRGLTKRFGGEVGVFDIDLDVARGDAICLLGPSGCGKTTLLRMIAGLLAPSAGAVRLQGRDLANVPVHQRDMGFVFQTWALFPHLNVHRNIEFGLSMRGVAKSERERRVQQALDLVNLGGLGHRMPRQLSGGQQQRVALARAIVINPSVLLLDEPMSSLDFNTRVEVRSQVRELQRRIGVTAIYVTHDYSEAMAVADRTVIMSGGRIVEAGDTATLFHHPTTEYAARFLGMHNVIQGTLVRLSAEGARVRIGGAVEVGFTDESFRRTDAVPGSDVRICCDQWSTALTSEGLGIPAVIESCTAEHGYTRILVRLAGTEQRLDLREPGISAVQIGSAVGLNVDWTKAWCLRA